MKGEGTELGRSEVVRMELVERMKEVVGGGEFVGTGKVCKVWILRCKLDWVKQWVSQLLRTHYSSSKARISEGNIFQFPKIFHELDALFQLRNCGHPPPLPPCVKMWKFWKSQEITGGPLGTLYICFRALGASQSPHKVKKWEHSEKIRGPQGVP